MTSTESRGSIETLGDALDALGQALHLAEDNYKNGETISPEAWAVLHSLFAAVFFNIPHSCFSRPLYKEAHDDQR